MALTVIDGEYRQVGAREAVGLGSCYFCGHALAKHPRDDSGNVLVNRHHRVRSLIRQVYMAVTNSKYPVNDTHLYWAGESCHNQFHRDHEYSSSKRENKLFTKLCTMIKNNPAFQISEADHHFLRGYLGKFMEKMEACDYGRKVLPEPATIRQNSSSFKHCATIALSTG